MSALEPRADSSSVPFLPSSTTCSLPLAAAHRLARTRLAPPPSLESTGTGKQLKVQLRNEGVDPAVVRDAVWWLKPGAGDWEALKAGKVKL